MREITRFFAFFLAFLLVFSLTITAAAFETRTGVVVVNDINLNVRTGPGLTYGVIETLPNGQRVTVTDSIENGSIIWYYITYNGSKKGYVSSDYVRLDPPPVVIDPNFERYMDEQGFPESYKEKLRTLHTEYPNWVFEAEHIVPDWDTVLFEESKTGVNMVHKDSEDSYKSVKPDAYNEATGTWAGLDGSTWVGASSEIIAYYLDPRNFLEERKVFQFVKHSFVADSGAIPKIKKMVKGSFLDANFPENGYATYSDALYHAGERSGVSPYVLASMIIVEQGNSGGGKCISGTVSGYEGLYNYLNIGAYASGGLDAVQRGLWWAGGEGSGKTTYDRPWNTRLKSLVGSAIYYGNNYINVGQDTLYLKKFDVIGDTATGYYWHQYMANIEGAETEASRLRAAYVDIFDTALVFKIPVYSGLPNSLYPKPSGSGTVPPRLLRDKIAALPALSAVTNADKPTADALMNTYGSLTAEQKAMVSNYSKLKAICDKLSGRVTRGDIDGDGKVDVSDVIFMRNVIMTGGSDEIKLKCDLDDDGAVDVSDVVVLRNIIMG